MLQADEAALKRMGWLGALQERLAQAAAAHEQPGAASSTDDSALRLEVQDKVCMLGSVTLRFRARLLPCILCLASSCRAN